MLPEFFPEESTGVGFFGPCRIAPLKSFQFAPFLTLVTRGLSRDSRIGVSMNKELFVTSTPHETKVAMTEDDQLAEIYLERENEYILAGSVYKGRVTREIGRAHV